jgi:hypothetical protein
MKDSCKEKQLSVKEILDETSGKLIEESIKVCKAELIKTNTNQSLTISQKSVVVPHFHYNSNIAPQGLVTFHVNILSMHSTCLCIDSIFTWIVTRPCDCTEVLYI